MESKGCQVSVLDCSTVRTVTTDTVIDHDISSTDFRMTCINRTHDGIWHKTRLGVSTFLKPMPRRVGYYTERFDVELEWRVPIADLREIVDEISQNLLGSNRLVKEIMLAFDDQLRFFANGNRCGKAVIKVLVSIDWSKIRERGGIVYIDELDLQLVPEGHRAKRIEHPFGPIESVKKSFRGSVPHIGPNTLVFSLKAVQNGAARDKADRYIALGGEVYQIPIERDYNLEDGVHLVCRNPVSAIYARDDIKDMCHKRFTFDAADKLFRLHRNAEDAMFDGDRDTVTKKELAELIHQQRLEEIRLKGESNQQDFERNREALERKEEVADRRFKEETVKEHTRNFSDWIKLVTGMMAAVVGVIGFINKLKPT